MKLLKARPKYTHNSKLSAFDQALYKQAFEKNVQLCIDMNICPICGIELKSVEEDEYTITFCNDNNTHYLDWVWYDHYEYY